MAGKGARVAKKKSTTTKKQASKRKRRDEEEDVSDDQSGSDVESITIESPSEAESEPSDEEFHDDEKDQDFEPSSQPRTSRKKKTTKRKTTSEVSTPKKKKLKTGSVATSKKSKSGETKKGSKKTSKKKDKKEVEEDLVVLNEDKESLFAIVRQESVAIREIIDEWQERFDKNKAKAVAELVVFILHSAGGAGDLKLSAKKVKEDEDKKIKKIIEDLVEEMPAQLQVYPLVNNHPSLKFFKKNFSEFWNTFIDVTKESALYDDMICTNFIKWLIAMTTSTCRALRHTACVAIYQIAASVIDTRKTETKTLSKLQKQAKAAKSKKKENELQDLCEDCQEKLNKLESLSRNIFTSVFMKRYRDSCEDIRGLSALQAGEWVLSLPEHFLEDSTLKFFGWILNDKQESIRKLAIQILDKFYSKKDWKDQLTNFTKQFLPRYISLIGDISVAVAVEAIKLLTTLLKNGYLTDSSDIEAISKTIVDENASLRYYAGVFVYNYLLSKSEKETTVRSKKTKKSKSSEVYLEDILDFISENLSSIPMAPFYVVDNLWSTSNEILRDYKNICDMINEEKGDALTLIGILNASIKKLKGSTQVITSSADHVKTPNKVKLTQKEIEEELEELSNILAPNLPSMIDKYRTEPAIVTELVEIPQHLDFSTYTDSHFAKLLKSLKEALFKNTSSEVFAQVAKTFNYLIKVHEDYPLKSEANLQFNELMREMSSQLKDAVQSLHNDEEPTSDVLATLNRILAFCRVLGTQVVSEDILQGDLHLILDSKITELEMSQKGDQSPSVTEEVDEVTPILLSILYDDLFWSLKDFMAAKGDEQVRAEKKYWTKQEKLINQLFYILKIGRPSNKITQLAYSAICTIFSLVNPHTTKFSRLVPKATTEQLENIKKYFHATMSQIKEEYSQFEKKKPAKDDDEEEETQEDQEEKEERANKLKALKTKITDTLLLLGRAITYKSLPDSLVADVLSYFVRTGIPSVEECVKRFHHELKATSEGKLWEYEFDALKILFSDYLQKMEQEDEYPDKEIKQSLKDVEDLASRLGKSHFPGKDTKHVEMLVSQTINYIFDDINQYHTFIPCLMKYRLKGIPDSKRKEFISTINRKMDQTDDISKKAKSNLEKLIEMLEVKKKASDETDEEREQEKSDKEEETTTRKDEMEVDDDNTQISEAAKDNEEDEDLI